METGQTNTLPQCKQARDRASGGMKTGRQTGGDRVTTDGECKQADKDRTNRKRQE